MEKWELEVLAHMGSAIQIVGRHAWCYVAGEGMEEQDCWIDFPSIEDCSEIEVDKELKKAGMKRLSWKKLSKEKGSQISEWEIEAMKHMCHKISDLSRYGHCCVWGKTVGLHDSQVFFPCLKEGTEIVIDEELKKNNVKRS